MSEAQGTQKSTSKIRIILKLFFGIFVFIFPWFVYYVYGILQTVPDYNKLLEYSPIISTHIFDQNREIIAEIADEKRVFVKSADIPQQLKNAFISAEDKTFYTNKGIDISGLTRAMMKNIVMTLRDKRYRYIGASTITQQIARNILLSNERTVTRKVKEFYLAYQISKVLSKDKILEIYLNHIYLGSRSYGVVAAARSYFDKNISDLSINEMAILASLPKAPSVLDPRKLGKNQSRIIERRNYVLRRMLDDKYITKAEYNQACESEIKLSPPKSESIGDAFVDYVKYALGQNNLSDRDLATGGYSISTTMKKNWQIIAQNALDDGVLNLDKILGFHGIIGNISIDNWAEEIKKIPVPMKINKHKLAVVLSRSDNKIEIGLQDGSKSHIDLSSLKWVFDSGIRIEDKLIKVEKVKDFISPGDVVVVGEVANNKHYTLEQVPELDGGVVIMSPKSGDIYAMVGGYGDVRATFNRAFQAKRQPGSTAKIFTYLGALESGVLPSDVFLDSEISFNTGDGTVWSPRNWTRTYSGPVTMRTGFERSLNVITVRIADMIGIKSVIKTMRKLGAIHDTVEPNLSVSLGTNSITLLDLTRSFAILANYGKFIEPKAISRIEKGDNLVYSSKKDDKIESEGVDKIEPDNLKNAMVNESDNQEPNSINMNKYREGYQVVDERSAYQIISFMIGTVRNGTASKMLKDYPLSIAGKTGTSQEGKDLWFMGFTPDIVVGIYMGYDMPRATDVYASSYAVPVFKDIITNLKPFLSEKNFRVPSGVKIVKINKRNGLRTTGGGPNVVYEVFKDTDELPRFEDSKQIGGIDPQASSAVSGVY